VIPDRQLSVREPPLQVLCLVAGDGERYAGVRFAEVLRKRLGVGGEEGLLLAGCGAAPGFGDGVAVEDEPKALQKKTLGTGFSSRWLASGQRGLAGVAQRAAAHLLLVCSCYFLHILFVQGGPPRRIFTRRATVVAAAKGRPAGGLPAPTQQEER
jgi:hypothetical protein